jgi:hypothetical protein
VIIVDCLGAASFQIPFPVQIVGSGYTRDPLLQGPHVRTAAVRQAGIDCKVAVLDFPALSIGYAAGPFGGRCSTEVRRLEQVGTPEQALEHFCSTGKVPRKSLPGATRVQDLQRHQLVTVDLARAGCAPGNTYVYVISQPGPTLYFAPTHYFQYQWDEMTLPTQT